MLSLVRSPLERLHAVNQSFNELKRLSQQLLTTLIAVVFWRITTLEHKRMEAFLFIA